MTNVHELRVKCEVEHCNYGNVRVECEGHDFGKASKLGARKNIQMILKKPPTRTRPTLERTHRNISYKCTSASF